MLVTWRPSGTRWGTSCPTIFSNCLWPKGGTEPSKVTIPHGPDNRDIPTVGGYRPLDGNTWLKASRFSRSNPHGFSRERRHFLPIPYARCLFATYSCCDRASLAILCRKCIPLSEKWLPQFDLGPLTAGRIVVGEIPRLNVRSIVVFRLTRHVLDCRFTHA